MISRAQGVAIAALCAAIAHLLLAALAAAHVRIASGTSLGRCLEAYQAYTGTDNAYGFFAPAVASEWRTVFDLYDPRDRRWKTEGWNAPNPEAGLLLSTINGHFSLENLREPLAASWAGAELGVHPWALMVIVKLRAYLIAKMTEYRRGKRPEWRTLLAYPFTTAERARR